MSSSRSELFRDIERLVEKLKGGAEVGDSLQLLNTLLASNPAAVQATLQCLPLPVLFSFLQTGDGALVELTCSLLDKLLHLLRATELVLHGTYLELGLQYPESRLVKTCLQALESHSSEECVQKLVSGETMLHLICQTLAGHDLQCSSLTTRIIRAVFPVAIATGRQQVLLTELKTLLSRGPVVRMRVYELCVEVCLHVAMAAELVTEGALLGRLLCELEGDDVLVKMNGLELLCRLVECEAGRVFIRNNAVMETLHTELSKCKEDAFGAMLIPSLLKFYGQLCAVSSGRSNEEVAELYRSYPEFVDVALQAALDTNDQSVWGVAVDTVGLFLSLPAGRCGLLPQEQGFLAVLASWGQVLVSGSSESRCRVLHAIKMMVSCDEGVVKWEESRSRRWCSVIHAEFFKQLVDIMKQPFPDLSLAGLSVAMEMARWEWGQREMQQCPGFLEYLLHRGGGVAGKEGLHLKYEIVCRCVESGCGQEVWGNVDFLRLRKYQREGPFYQPADTSIALQES